MVEFIYHFFAFGILYLIGLPFTKSEKVNQFLNYILGMEE